MSLRNILLSISIIIIGFCLSLYFQTDTNVETMNLDLYKNLQYNEERSHSLADLNQKLGPHKLEEIIEEIYTKNQQMGVKTRVMELGAGNGRVLMELRRKFPEIELYGINKEKTHTFYRRESFILTALKFQIFNKEEIQNIDLPYLLFQDLDFGTKISYGDGKFDLIYSQSTIEHIKYKFELFNEIMRVLKIGGISIHTDTTGLLLYSDGVVLDIRSGLNELRRSGIDITTTEGRSIRFKKTEEEIIFPVTPHHPIPTKLNHIPSEMRRPDMGYNITTK